MLPAQQAVKVYIEIRKGSDFLEAKCEYWLTMALTVVFLVKPPIFPDTIDMSKEKDPTAPRGLDKYRKTAFYPCTSPTRPPHDPTRLEPRCNFMKLDTFYLCALIGAHI